MNCLITRVGSLANRSKLAFALALSLIAWAANASGASLKPETVNAWDEYIQNANLRIQQRVSNGRAFLWADDTPDRAARVLGRQIVVEPATFHVPAKVPSGLVHDWMGAAFIPNAQIDDVLCVVRDYARYSDFYGPNVTDSRAIATGGAIDRFSMVLLNKTVFSRIALQSEYQTSYIRIDDRRLYSVSGTTGVREIAEFGSPGQHILPKDQGTGLIWRMYSTTRMEERDGGVHIEMEVIALSRDIPAAVRWFAEPMVRRASREYMATTLRQTRDAVECSLAGRCAPQAISVKSGTSGAEAVNSRSEPFRRGRLR